MSKQATVQRVGLALSFGRVLAGKLWVWEAKRRGATFEGTVRFEGRPVISVAPESRMTFGANVTVNSALRSNPLGCFQPSVLRTLGPGAELILERNSGLSGSVICAGVSVRVGEGTIIGSGAMIIDNDFHRLEEGLRWVNEYQRNARPIQIGKRVFIGARAIILKGVSIGDDSLVGAGAVVTCDVPPRHLAAGNPARVTPLAAPTAARTTAG